MKKVKRMSIKQSMIGLFIINIIIFLVVIFWGYMQQYNRIVVQNNKNFNEILSQLSLNTQSRCKNYNNIIEKIAYSDVVQKYLETDSVVYRADNYANLKSYVWNLVSGDDVIKDLAIFGTEGEEFNLSGQRKQLAVVFDEIPENQLYYYSGVKSLSFDADGRNHCKCIVVGAYIYSMATFDQKNPIGMILMSLDARRLFGIYSSNDENYSNLLLFGRDGSVIYDGFGEDKWQYGDIFDKGKEKFASKVEKDGNTYYVRGEEIPFLDGKAVLAISDEQLFKDTDIVRRNRVVMMLLALLVEIPLFYFVVRNITLPLNHFISFMNRIENGDIQAIKQKTDVEGPVEIRILQTNFNQMLGKIDDLNHKLVHTTMSLYEMEMEKKQAELEYLYAQINPHFLSNTLEAIKGCAITEEAWKSYRMLDALGMLFRYSVKMDSQVNLSEEIQLAKNYLFIQKMRLGDKLEYFCRIPEEMEKVKIPKMILQPIIENAIQHGITKIPEGGKIWIDGERYGNDIILRVQNDGLPITEMQCQELQKWISEESVNNENGSYHIGIKNVHKRLCYTYENGGIKVMPCERGGLVVELLLCGGIKAL